MRKHDAQNTVIAHCEQNRVQNQLAGLRVCVCGVTEYPVTNFRLSLLPQGDAGDLCGRHPTKTPHLSCDIEADHLDVPVHFV